MADAKLTTNAGEITPGDLFNARNFLQIPFFQRPYKWDKRKLGPFQADLLGVVDRKHDIHFLGAIITTDRRAESRTHPDLVEIIDGQQRLTTIFIHLCAITHSLIEEGQVNEAKDLFELCIANTTYSGAMSNIRLQSGGPDRWAVNEMVRSVLKTRNFGEQLGGFKLRPLSEYGGEGEKRSKVLSNFKSVKTFLKLQLEEAGIDRIREIREALLGSMAFVEIRVSDPSVGPKIFDSLNSQQEPMSTGDLVKNDVFSKLADAHIEELRRLDDEEWQPFYKKFDVAGKLDKLFDGYFFPYGLIHNPQLTTASVYRYLLNEWKDMSPEDVIQELMIYQDAYLAFAADQAMPDIDPLLQKEITKLVQARAPSSTYPFVIQLVTKTRDGSAKDTANAIAVLEVIQSFLVRRGLSGKEPTGLHAVFKGLWGDVDGKPAPKNVAAAISRHKTVERPNDEVVTNSIRTRDAYAMKITPFVLREYDLYLDGDDAGLPAEIEHILPQNPDKGWDSFSPEQRNARTHTLANLLPLTEKMNKSVSHAAYSAKRKRFHKSAFESVRHLARTYEDWTPDELEKRSDVLAEWAIARWPDPFTDI